MAFLFASASSQYLIGGSAPVTAEPLTISCWYRPTSTPGVNVVVSINGATGNDRFMLVVRSSDMQAIRIDTAGSATTAVSAVSTNNAGEWVHLLGVFGSSGENIAAYRNGAVGTPVTNPGTSITVNRILIGARLSGGAAGAFANGDIAEVGVWNVALSAAEIAALSKGVTPARVRASNLAYELRLIRTIQDLRRGLVMTNTNGATVSPHPRIIG
jgi:hypothetical protein